MSEVCGVSYAKGILLGLAVVATFILAGEMLRRGLIAMKWIVENL